MHRRLLFQFGHSHSCASGAEDWKPSASRACTMHEYIRITAPHCHSNNYRVSVGGMRVRCAHIMHANEFLSFYTVRTGLDGQEQECPEFIIIKLIAVSYEEGEEDELTMCVCGSWRHPLIHIAKIESRYGNANYLCLQDINPGTRGSFQNSFLNNQTDLLCGGYANRLMPFNFSRIPSLLRIIKFCVCPIQGQECTVRPFLHNFSILDYANDIGVLYGAQSVCDDQTCPSRTRRIQCLLNNLQGTQGMNEGWRYSNSHLPVRFDDRVLTSPHPIAKSEDS